MNFEWDTEKAQINERKHHIRFDDAKFIFSDPLRIERCDWKHTTATEYRWQTIGMTGSLLFVVYTDRNDSYRIISARLADSAEKEAYYGYKENNIDGWTEAD